MTGLFLNISGSDPLRSSVKTSSKIFSPAHSGKYFLSFEQGGSKNVPFR